MSGEGIVLIKECEWCDTKLWSMVECWTRNRRSPRTNTPFANVTKCDLLVLTVIDLIYYAVLHRD